MKAGTLGRRWTGNTVAFIGSIVALLAGSVSLTWGVPHVLSLGAFAESAGGEDAEGHGAVEPSGLQHVLEQIRSLDTTATDPQAIRALDRALCAGLPTQPLASVSVVVGDGGTTQIVVFAMPPGAGTWAASEVAASWPQCLNAMPGAGSSWMPTWAATSQAWNARTSVWSRGDMVVIGSGDDEDLQAVDDVLQGALIEHRCLNLSPDIDAHLENPIVAGEDYRHPTRLVRVEVDPIVPEGPDGEELEPPASSDIPHVGAPVELPEVPEGRTYWPDLPDVVERPVIEPVQDRPATATLIEVERDDPLGPGCGWEFAAYTPAPTADASDEQIALLSEDAQSALTGAWQAWAESVELFWANHSDYLEAAAAYDEYRSAVAEVSFQWEYQVAPLWDAYEEAMEAHAEAVKARNLWREEHEAARQEWDGFLATCLPADQPELSDDGEGPQTTPAPTPSPSPTSEPGATGVRCDSREAPEILSQTAPDVPDLPAVPAPAEEDLGNENE